MCIRDSPTADGLQMELIDEDVPFRGLDLAGNELDDGGLAGTGGTHQEDKLPVIDVHGDPLQGFVAGVVRFYHICKFYHNSFAPDNLPKSGSMNVAGGQIFPNHEGHLENNGVIKLPQIQPGELLDLLQSVHQGIPVDKKLEMCIRDRS